MPMLLTIHRQCIDVNDDNVSHNKLMANIECVQYEAALAITGTWQGTSRIKLYVELGLRTLSDRRSFNRVIPIFKIKNNLIPRIRQRKTTSTINRRCPKF